MDMNPDTPVKVVNTEDREFVVKYGEERYLLEANSTTALPWRVVAYYLGDPFKKNTPVYDYGEHEWNRFRRRHGISASMHLSDEEWEEKRPKLEVYTVVDEDRIYMLNDGRQHENLTDFKTGYGEDELKMQVAALQSQLASLMAAQEDSGKPIVVTEGTTGDDAGPTEENELPTDSGTAKSARRGRS